MNHHHHQALASSSSIISPSSSSSANTPIAGIIEKQEPNTTTPALSSVAVLVGSLVSSPSIYTDLHQHRSMYFAFPDLSVRLVGQYRLQFTLFSLGRYVRVCIHGVGSAYLLFLFLCPIVLLGTISGLISVLTILVYHYIGATQSLQNLILILLQSIQQSCFQECEVIDQESLVKFSGFRLTQLFF